MPALPSIFSQPGYTLTSSDSSEVVRLGTSLGPGFLAHVLTRYLTHLEQLRIKRSGKVMGNEDLKAISCLTNLQRLEVCNLVCSNPTRILFVHDSTAFLCDPTDCMGAQTHTAVFH